MKQFEANFIVELFFSSQVQESRESVGMFCPSINITKFAGRDSLYIREQKYQHVYPQQQ